MSGDEVKSMRADRRLADLGNAISDAIAAALVAGVDADKATSVAIAVAADYWHAAGYEQPVTALAAILEAKAHQLAGGGRA